MVVVTTNTKVVLFFTAILISHTNCVRWPRNDRSNS